MESLFSQYIKSRGGKEIIENDKGFATYYYVNDGIYMEDLFVKEEFRKSGEATKLADQVSEIGKSKGCKYLYGSVCPSANGSTTSMKVFFAYGMKLDSSINNLIYLKKEIL